MSFVNDNDEFETWLRAHCSVVEDDLVRKHDRMRSSAFAFLRATFFRWAKRVEIVCGDLASAPKTLAIGDIHLENFGTWRDAEGRLVWGVNDFDEATIMPYAYDLVRLATSVRLAPGLNLSGRRICEAILLGYGRGLRRPRPTILDDHAVWMRDRVACSNAEREKFWHDLTELPSVLPPADAVAALTSSMPPDATRLRFSARARGGGSLGRPRFVAVANWCGGRIAREVKALVPSAWTWAHARKGKTSRFLDAARGAHRAPDPLLNIVGPFIVRRIAADSRKVELGSSAGAGLEERLLSAMGADLAAIHAVSSARIAEIEKHLQAQPADWLRDASRAMKDDVEQDFDSY